MILSTLLLSALAAHAAAPARSAPPPPPAHDSDLSVEASLRSWAITRKPAAAEIPAGFSAEDKATLKDAVSEKPSLRREISIADASEKSRLARRLPGLSEDPFNVCRTLERCHSAPTSFHVEDEVLIPDAVVALARPWIALEKARGRRLNFTPSTGTANLVARLDTSNGPLVIRASAASTGGFDVWISESDAAARRFLAEKAELLGAE